MNDSERTEKSKDEALHPPHHIPQTLVVVGTETALFDKTSKVRERILASVAAFREVHIIVMCGRGFAEESVGHVHIHPTNSPARLGRALGAWRLGRSLGRADVVTVQDPFESGFAGWLVARSLGAALHAQVHTDLLSPAFAKHSWLNRARVGIARFVLSRASGIRVVSKRIKSSLEASGWRLRVEPTVLPIFVGIERFRTAPRDTELEVRFAPFKTKLLVVSRLEEEKNVGLALHAFKESAPPDSCLIVIGTGRERSTLSALARKLEITERVFFEGRRDPAAYYTLADLVLVTSKYEGYGMVIVEALASGKPVLSTDVGIASEAGAIVAAEDGYAAALKQWFEDGPRTAELKGYPYANFEEYIYAYTENLKACIKK